MPSIADIYNAYNVFVTETILFNFATILWLGSFIYRCGCSFYMFILFFYHDILNVWIFKLKGFHTFLTLKIISRGQIPFSPRGIIAFSISTSRKKGSGRIYRVYLVFTLTNVLIIRISLWPRALKRWCFMLRGEMEFDEVVRWICLQLWNRSKYVCTWL